MAVPLAGAGVAGLAGDVRFNGFDDEDPAVDPVVDCLEASWLAEFGVSEPLHSMSETM